MDVVELETRLRMSEGWEAKFGEPISDEDYIRLCRIAELARLNPLVNTFAEVATGIKKVTKNLKPKARYAKA